MGAHVRDKCFANIRRFVVNDSFLIAFQAQYGVSDLAVAKARFIKETMSRHKAAQSNLRAHPSMDIIWSYGATHQQCAFRLIAKFRAICIKHNSASESVLFRRIANNKTIAGECKNWRCES